MIINNNFDFLRLTFNPIFAKIGAADRQSKPCKIWTLKFHICRYTKTCACFLKLQEIMVASYVHVINPGQTK